MHAKLFSATTVGVDAHPVEIEVDLSFGMIQFHIVGLPDAAIRESKQRIVTALKNSGIRLPERKITVNLAPADLKKEGTLFDLPIALGILVAGEYLTIATQFLQETLFLGELSLDGKIRPIKGALSIACDAKKLSKKRMIVPEKNAHEAALISEIEVIGCSSITELVAYLKGEISLTPAKPLALKMISHEKSLLDFAQVKGQESAKRALQIAAAGQHNILFIGPPGAGKTMLAQRFSTLMPPMTFEEIVETSKVYSVTGKLSKKGLVQERPIRSPHHTISTAGLVGGGAHPQPGEISLAHNGILFLDELTEFRRDTLEVLRQPLENKHVIISRAQSTINFPASFVLIAALNPCPCGFMGDKKKTCICTPHQITRYLRKLSGPLLDRIDIHVHVQSVDYDTIQAKHSPASSSLQLYEKVQAAREIQTKRFGKELCNSSLNATQVEEWCTLTPEAQEIMRQAYDRLGLSMRGYHKILKISRTIADLEGASMIERQHIQEAIMYRSLDQTLPKY